MVEFCIEPIKKYKASPDTEAYHPNCFFHRDFEEDGENPDWVSELQKQVGWQDVYDGKLLGERA